MIKSTLGGNRGDGIVKTKLKDFGWEYWFECPYITYEKTVEKPQEKPAETTNLKAGDKVKVKNGAKTYTGTSLAVFVYGQVYDVMEIKGDRVVIGQKRKITAAVRSGDLMKT